MKSDIANLSTWVRLSTKSLTALRGGATGGSEDDREVQVEPDG